VIPYPGVRISAAGVQPAGAPGGVAAAAERAVLFIGGVVFCDLDVLPPALDFLLGFNESQFDTQLRASDYYDFATLTMLALGLGFQVPVGVLAVTRLGVLTAARLRRSRRYAIVGIGVAGGAPANARPRDPAARDAARPRAL
jgi:Sec-independent protein secretion pathway component TatC